MEKGGLPIWELTKGTEGEEGKEGAETAVCPGQCRYSPPSPHPACSCPCSTSHGSKPCPLPPRAAHIMLLPAPTLQTAPPYPQPVHTASQWGCCHSPPGIAPASTISCSSSSSCPCCTALGSRHCEEAVGMHTRHAVAQPSGRKLQLRCSHPSV